jgi:L,D-peptidoglycan transpeptidase YkuD (ErfK/YbiS/YcfS/YnhG family)
VTPGPGDLVVGPWGARFLGRRFACAVGRGGMSADKREGDGATPLGILRLTGTLWRADRMAPPGGVPTPTRPIGPADLWSDDPRDPDYNRPVRGRFRAFGHERLMRPDPLYDLVALTDWNADPPRPGLGSAIFLHVRRAPRRPTEGCIAFARRHLLWILRRWRPESRVVVRPRGGL